MVLMLTTSPRFRDSPIFDARTGFGGDGDPWSNYCVKDGPFSTYNLSLGPGAIINDHCLTREFNSSMLLYITAKAVKNATIQPTFETFRVELEGRLNVPGVYKPHSGGHRSVGGDMGDIHSSPGGKPRYFRASGSVDLRIRSTVFFASCSN
jgi:tyrosinase